MRRLVALLFLLAIACGPSPPFRQGAGSSAPRAEGPEQVRVRRLLVSYRGAEGAAAEVTRSREDATERAELIAGLLRDPDASFREIVNDYGDVPPDTDDRSRSRVLARDSTEWPEDVLRAGLELDVGQVSRPIDTPAGFVILMREPDGESQSGPVTIGARHILIAFRGASQAAQTVTRSREEAEELARQIASFARDGTHDWTELHRRYSDEPGSPAGGDLGVFGRGEMVGAFERAAFGLDVDEISDPVESQYGFHVIQRTR
jgi:hypothetical protein